MSTDFWDAAQFALSVTMPSILLLGLGWFLRRSGQVDGPFCDQASKLVFRYSMPALLFFSIYANDTDYGSQLALIGAGALASLLLFFGAEAVAAWKIPDVRDKGVFVQGVYRANTMIVGLAFVSSAYGQAGVAAGAVYGGSMTLLYNVLAVLTLSRAQGGSGGLKAGLMLRQIALNPLILGILAALAARAIALPVPTLLQQTGHYLAVIALPLALICAGATLDVKSLFKVSDISLWSSLGRLIVSPLLAVLVGWLFGLEGMALGILFMMMAAPVAAASYVMAKAMGANDVAAANIVGLTTVGAMPVAAAGIALLRSAGWI
ncbi:putative permease [Neisseria sp. HSC-16F19]|nr:AEC family transporter [Neisseria sp. HSC-16F19]MCP2039947.1 putative permease [Neisseria sp. HSC-16F19]